MLLVFLIIDEKIDLIFSFCIKMCNINKSPNQLSLSSSVAKSIKAVNIGSLSTSNSISISNPVVTFSAALSSNGSSFKTNSSSKSYLLHLNDKFFEFKFAKAAKESV